MRASADSSENSRDNRVTIPEYLPKNGDNSTVSLLSALADHLIDNELGAELLEDADRQAITHSGEITNNDYHRIKSQLTNLLENEQVFKGFVGTFLTNAKHELDLMPSDEPFSRDEVSELLTIHGIKRLGGLRAFYFEDTINDGVCYINGEQKTFSSDIAPVIKLLCDQCIVTPDELAPWCDNDEFLSLMIEVLNQGFWFWVEASE